MVRKWMAAVMITALIAVAAGMTGCQNQDREQGADGHKISSAQSEMIDISGKDAVKEKEEQEESADTSQTSETSAEESADSDEASETETSADVEDDTKQDASSDDRTNDASTNDASTNDASTNDASTNDTSTNDASMEEGAETSEDGQDGYYFDDEQIVTHYHDAKAFTNDETFNELFSKNKIDQQYKEETEMMETLSQMREAAIRYGEIWKAEVTKAYQKLFDALKDKPEEQQKLEKSQQEWESSLSDAESSLREEAEENGTLGPLAADNSVMNYYKGRACVLYHQLYLLNGSFSMD